MLFRSGHQRENNPKNFKLLQERFNQIIPKDSSWNGNNLWIDEKNLLEKNTNCSDSVVTNIKNRFKGDKVESKKRKVYLGAFVLMGLLTILSIVFAVFNYYSLIREKESNYIANIKASINEIENGSKLNAIKFLSKTGKIGQNWEWFYLASKLGFAPIRIREDEIKILDTSLLKSSNLYKQIYSNIDKFNPNYKTHGDVDGDVEDQKNRYGRLIAKSNDNQLELRETNSWRGGSEISLLRKTDNKYYPIWKVSADSYENSSKAYFSNDDTCIIIHANSLRADTLDLTKKKRTVKDSYAEYVRWPSKSGQISVLA